jgi:hypothetical protein
MSQADRSHPRAMGTGWEVLGEIELTASSDATYTVSQWLARVCSPLQLQAPFVSRILSSAQESITRTMQAEPVRKFEHVHLLVFAPSERAAEARTWGFFRIEKAEDSLEAGRNPDHAIAFYLYLDGGGGRSG